MNEGIYGTRIGDIWLADDSEVGQMLESGEHLVHEVFAGEDGKPVEKIYVAVENDDMKDLIEEARTGAERWRAERAANS